MDVPQMKLEDAYQLLNSTFGDTNWKKPINTFTFMCLRYCEELTDRSDEECQKLFMDLSDAWQAVYSHETIPTSTTDSDDTDFSSNDESSSNCACSIEMAGGVNTELMIQQMNKMMVDFVKRSELANAKAEELISEEEHLKMKQEKRREKKKRRKEKLKVEKEATSSQRESESSAAYESVDSSKADVPKLTKSKSSKLKTNKLDRKKKEENAVSPAEEVIVGEKFGEMESDIDLDFILAKKGHKLKNSKVDRNANVSTKVIATTKLPDKEIREKGSGKVQGNSKLINSGSEESKLPSRTKISGKEMGKLKIDKSSQISNGVGDGPHIRPGKVQEAEIAHESNASSSFDSAALGYTYGRQGNFRAEMGEFEEAVECYTKAIKILTNDSKLYGNRACCYEKLGEYEKALDDANKAIDLDPSLCMNYFRKGVALGGLKRYREAEIAFKMVLKIDPQCCFPIRELLLLRKAELMDMGFSENQAYTSACVYKTVQGAINGILENRIPKDPYDIIFMSDDEDDAYQALTLQENINEVPSNAKNSKPSDVALWVGNVVTTTENAELHHLFSKYGEIQGIFVMREKTRDGCHSAFVDFKNSSSVDKCIAGLNGYNLHGKNLIIRRPTKNAEGAVPKAKFGKQDPSKTLNPVKDIAKLKLFSSNTECRYWRSLGFCNNGDLCNFKHIPEHRLIDRK